MSKTQQKILNCVAKNNFAFCLIQDHVRLKYKTLAKHVETLQSLGYVRITKDMYGDGSQLHHWEISTTMLGKSLAK